MPSEHSKTSAKQTDFLQFMYLWNSLLLFFFLLKLLNYTIIFPEFTFCSVTFILYTKLKIFCYSKQGIEELSKNNPAAV